MTERKAVIKNADMSEEMQQDAIDCATQVGQSIQFSSRDQSLPLPLALSPLSPALVRA